MKLSLLIDKAQALLSENGDLDVLDTDYYAVFDISVEEAKGLPADWGLPDGTKFIQIDSLR